MGGTTEWLDPELQTRAHGGRGEAGMAQGYPVAGFVTLPGTLTSVAARRGFGTWTAAIRHERGNGLSLFENPTRPSDYLDSRSTHVAVREESDAHSVQANVVSTGSTETSDTRRGVWVEGEWKRGTALYGLGYLRLDPKLSWSGQGMSSDSEGVYARGLLA